MKQTISWIFAVLAFSLFAHTAQAAPNSGPGPCQLQIIQEESKWAFDAQYVYEEPQWSAERSAAELLTTQSQYFSNKSSPFIKNTIPPELAFYNPRISFQLEPYVTYSQTIDGRACAQIVGAKLTITHQPEIYLARELAARNCVSRAALSHQLKHNQVTVEELKSIVQSKAELKKLIFPTYEKQGAAGKTTSDIARQLAAMGQLATLDLQGRVQTSIRTLRRQKVETRENFIALYQSCQGEFEKASALAQPNGNGEHKE